MLGPDNTAIMQLLQMFMGPKAAPFTGGIGDTEMPPPGMTPATSAGSQQMPMAQLMSAFSGGRTPGGMGLPPPAAAAASPMPATGGPTNIVPPGLAGDALPGGTKGGFDPQKLAAMQALVEPEQGEGISPPGAPAQPRPNIDPGMLFAALTKMGISPAQIPQLSNMLRR